MTSDKETVIELIQELRHNLIRVSGGTEPILEIKLSRAAWARLNYEAADLTKYMSTVSFTDNYNCRVCGIKIVKE